ncbi:hypothetical protein V2A85_22830, partial [Yersinia sp. 1252 StPb PI]|uniref:hypothetical protein n=1 Tax=Yersinia sp. 1252 StPb PI TaxID=3117404 RepID=UPI003B28D771
LRGSARRRHVLRVRSIGCALSTLNLLAPITPISSDNYLTCQLEFRGRMIITIIRGFIELSKKDISSK